MPLPGSLPLGLGGAAGKNTPVGRAARDALGADLLWTDDLQVGANGDYQLVEGVENVRRSILRRLLVRPGEYKLRPNYGVGVTAYVKKRLTSAARDQLRGRILEQLLADDRIEAVADVDIAEIDVAGGTAIRVRVRAQVLGRTVEFQPFDFSREV